MIVAVALRTPGSGCSLSLIPFPPAELALFVLAVVLAVLGVVGLATGLITI